MLYCLWKGEGTDTRIFITDSPDAIPYLLLKDGMAIIQGRTSHGPALTRKDDKFYCLWKGEGSDTRMFISLGDLTGTAWGRPQQVGGQTSHGPALARGPGGKLYRLWKNSVDNAIMISIGTPISWTSVEWTAQQQIVGLTSNTPSLANIWQ
jgi:hypothetical protein